MSPPPTLGASVTSSSTVTVTMTYFIFLAGLTTPWNPHIVCLVWPPEPTHFLGAQPSAWTNPGR